jgi:hypothetical protein
MTITYLTSSDKNNNNNSDNNYPNYLVNGECCVCIEPTTGISQQFYSCSNTGIHYICNYCYTEWQRQHPNNGCPMCRAPHLLDIIT